MSRNSTAVCYHMLEPAHLVCCLQWQGQQLAAPLACLLLAAFGSMFVSLLALYAKLGGAAATQSASSGCNCQVLAKQCRHCHDAHNGWGDISDRLPPLLVAQTHKVHAAMPSAPYAGKQLLPSTYKVRVWHTRNCPTDRAANGTACRSAVPAGSHTPLNCPNAAVGSASVAPAQPFFINSLSIQSAEKPA